MKDTLITLDLATFPETAKAVLVLETMMEIVEEEASSMSLIQQASALSHLKAQNLLCAVTYHSEHPTGAYLPGPANACLALVDGELWLATELPATPDPEPTPD